MNEASVAGVIARSRIGSVGNVPTLTVQDHLDPGLYKKVDRFIAECGGTWRTKHQAHVFTPGTDVADALAKGIAQGWHEEVNEFDFFPTPPGAADQLIETALSNESIELLNDPEYGDYRLSVLEPSAGRNALLDALFRQVPRERVDVTAFEIDHRNATRLHGRGYDLVEGDFLTAPVGKQVDYAIMNPPFSQKGMQNAWLRHVQQARKWLKPTGTLVAIIPQLPGRLRPNRCDQPLGMMLQPTSKEADILDLLADIEADGTYEELPDNTFQTSDKRLNSTGVKTAILTLDAQMPWKDKPTNGWSNWYTWATHCIVENNDHELLQAMVDETTWHLPSVERTLMRYRHSWIARCAPWVESKVNLSELARHFVSHYRDEGAMTKTRPADTAEKRPAPRMRPGQPTKQTKPGEATKTARPSPPPPAGNAGTKQLSMF